MAVLVQNENMKNQSLVFKGETYQCDENGVLRCSPLFAEFLLDNNPGNHWKKFTRDLISDAKTLKNEVLQCEANLRAADRALIVAKKKLADFEKESVVAEKLDSEEVADPEDFVPSPVVASDEETSDDEKAEILEEDFPTMQWNKPQIVAFAEKHGIEVDPNDTKADLLEAIEAATE